MYGNKQRIHFRGARIVIMLNKEKYKEKLEDILAETIKVSKNGTICKCCDMYSCTECIFYNGNCGGSEETKKWLNSEYIEPILDEAEKRYLKAVIKPFRDKVKYMLKNSSNKEFISIVLEDKERKEYFNFPYFKKGTMYKGMEINKRYTLEELGL